MTDDTTPDKGHAHGGDWTPQVDEAIAALRKEFGNARIEYTGAGCYSICVDFEAQGYLLIGYAEGPLGEGGGFGADRHNPDGEYLRTMYRSDVQDVGALIQGIRDYMLHGKTTGLGARATPDARGDRHRAMSGHTVSPSNLGDPDCTICRDLRTAWGRD